MFIVFTCGASQFDSYWFVCFLTTINHQKKKRKEKKKSSLSWWRRPSEASHNSFCCGKQTCFQLTFVSRLCWPSQAICVHVTFHFFNLSWGWAVYFFANGLSACTWLYSMCFDLSSTQKMELSPPRNSVLCLHVDKENQDFGLQCQTCSPSSSFPVSDCVTLYRPYWSPYGYDWPTFVYS